MGAHGAFYMFRRDLWSPLPADTINDDFVLPMSIVAQGYRAVYDRSIGIDELERSGAKREFKRRVRLGAGALQQVLRTMRLADPRRPALALVFLSGKGLRAVMPLLLLAFLLANIGLAWHGSMLHAAIAASALAAAVAGLIAAAAAPRWLPRSAAVMAYAIQAYVAAGIGMLLVGAGLQARVWRLTDAPASRRAGQVAPAGRPVSGPSYDAAPARVRSRV